MTRQENAEKREKIGRKDLTDIRGIPYIIDVARISRAQKEETENEDFKRCVR